MVTSGDAVLERFRASSPRREDRSPTGSAKHWLALAALAAFGVVFGLAAIEAGLRVAGRRPWVSLGPRPGEPTLHDPDPEIGWILRPGHWRYGPYVPAGTPIEVTISADRTRRTGPGTDPRPDLSRPEILLLGCSFTFGWGVSDDETYAWGLQARRPDLVVRNRGTAAYGTWQALLLLERVLASGERPEHVIYGFIPEHGLRNVGNPNWLKALAMFTGQNIVQVPYCALGAGDGLLCHPPERYPAWPLRQWSAAMTALQDGWYELGTRGRATTADEVTRRLVARMAERCRSAGIRFSLLLLRVGTLKRDAIVPFAHARGIDVIDCDRPMRTHVLGDVHPSPGVHAEWAECLAASLGQ